MKLSIISDLHMSLREARFGKGPPSGMPEADACVLAGDVTDSLKVGLDWAGRTISQFMPVVMVLGNHDIYGEALDVVKAKARWLASYSPGLHLLTDSSVEISGVRFVGGTLWTDFRLFEHAARPITEGECRAIAKREMPEYDEVYATAGDGFHMGRRLTPKDTVISHDATVRYLDGELAAEHFRRTVVVTRHATSEAFVFPEYSHKASSAAFASDLTPLMMTRRPDLWVHGHFHHSSDYVIGSTRVVCNARGYDEKPNDDFDPGLVI